MKLLIMICYSTKLFFFCMLVVFLNKWRPKQIINTYFNSQGNAPFLIQKDVAKKDRNQYSQLILSFYKAKSVTKHFLNTSEHMDSNTETYH